MGQRAYATLPSSFSLRCCFKLNPHLMASFKNQVVLVIDSSGAGFAAAEATAQVTCQSRNRRFFEQRRECSKEISQRYKYHSMTELNAYPNFATELRQGVSRKCSRRGNYIEPMGTTATARICMYRLRSSNT